MAIGYAVAALIASVAVAVRMAYTNGPDAQASSGMYAFGDAIVFGATFGLCALVPTGVALLFLRSNRKFWNVLSVLVLGVAVTGIAAAIVFMVGRQETASALAACAAFSVLRILVAPLFAVTFLVCACFAPHRAARFAFMTAVVVEAVVAAYGGGIWFLPLLTNH